MSGNGTGSVYKYQKTVYKHGTGDDAGKKVKEKEYFWKVRYRYRDESGKLKPGRASGFKTKTEAQDYLNRLTLDIRDDKYVHKRDITLNEVADNWFRDYKALQVRKNTLDWHKYNLKHIRERFGNRQVQSIKANEIMHFYSDMMNDKVSITYVMNINRTFKQIMKYATSEKHKYVNLIHAMMKI